MRSIWRVLPGAALLLVLMAAWSGHAWAGGGALDVYGGVTLNRPVEVGISETRSSGTTSAAASIDSDTSGEFGLRLLGWYPPHPWLGLGLDVGYFRADGPGVSIDAIPFSMLLVLRAPLLPTSDQPGGRLQPYAMAGVSFYMADVSVQIEGMEASDFEVGWPLPGVNEILAGPYVAAGLAWQPTRTIALFGEYRYTRFDVGFDTTNSLILPTMNGRVDTSVTSDHVLLGISYRFWEVKTGDGSASPQ